MGKFPVSGVLKTVRLGRDLHHGSGSRRDGHYRIDRMTGLRFLLDETSWADWHREAE